MAENARTKAEIEAELDAARERLATNVAEILNHVHPRAVTYRAVADVRGRASAQLASVTQQVREQVVQPDGSWNRTRIALVAAAAAGAVAFIAVVRSIVRR